MNTLETIKERYQELQANNGSSGLTPIERNAFNAFSTMGIPTVKHEEWKYTRISGLFNKAYEFAPGRVLSELSARDLEPFRLPGHEEANELVFVNGQYASALSKIHSPAIVVLPLEEAAKGEEEVEAAVLEVELDMDEKSDDLERLCVIVETVKAHHDYKAYGEA